MKSHDNENKAPEQSDRFAALSLVRQTVAAGDRAVSFDASVGRMFSARLDYIIRALQLDELAVIGRGDDGEVLVASLTDFGTFVGERLVAGDTALLPGCGGVKVIETPEPFEPGESGDPLDRAMANGMPASILATAPPHYDEDVVAGSATSVIIDRLADWSKHPALKLCSRHERAVRRAWEVFSCDGLSFGLVLETDRGFQGIDSHGGSRLERSLPGAAWQVRVNC